MFTGLIEEFGVVVSLTRTSTSAKLVIAVGLQLATTKIGESVAVNGVCLTVTSLRRRDLEFDVSLESLKKTTLGTIKVGEKVNLERALLITGRLGGHLVTGHVDGLGEIKKKIIFDNKGFELHVSIPSDLLRYVVPKGSIALDGVSLTAADIRDALLVIAVVPHTGRATLFGSKGVGDQVNVEVDLLSKYIEKHLAKYDAPSGVTQELLDRAGFFPMGWIEN